MDWTDEKAVAEYIKAHTRKFWAKGEVRLHANGEVDEVVTGRVEGVHVEQMSDECFWMAIHGKDGRRMVLNFYITGKKRKRLRVSVEDDGEHNSGISEGFKA